MNKINRQGFAISTRGIPEYEIQRGKSTLGITLLRATGKLGDWGDFEIPSAQEKGKLSFEYSIIPHSDPFPSVSFLYSFIFFFQKKKTVDLKSYLV